MRFSAKLSTVSPEEGGRGDDTGATAPDAEAAAPEAGGCQTTGAQRKVPKIGWDKLSLTSGAIKEMPDRLWLE